jgi:hypothetical protein
MEVLGSRILLHPSEPERSHRFYRDTLGLAIYREFGSRDTPGLVFFLGTVFSRSVDDRRVRRGMPWRSGFRSATCGSSTSGCWRPGYR